MFPLNLGDSPEIREYLRGVLFADPDFRNDLEADTDAIDPYGNGNPAFWRGMLEVPGVSRIALDSIKQKSVPRVQFYAAPAILRKFLDYVEEQSNARSGMSWSWDPDEKLHWQALGGFIRIAGSKAQELVLAVYREGRFGRSSCRRVADDIIAWVPE